MKYSLPDLPNFELKTYLINFLERYIDSKEMKKVTSSIDLLIEAAYLRGMRDKEEELKNS